MKKIEKIFEEEMQKGMIQYNSLEFKNKYPTLRATILRMMHRSVRETIDEASHVVCGHSLVDDQRSIQKLKKQIK